MEADQLKRLKRLYADLLEIAGKRGKVKVDLDCLLIDIIHVMGGNERHDFYWVTGRRMPDDAE